MLLAATSAVASTSAAGPAPAAAQPAKTLVRVESGAPGRSIPTGFLGLAMEYRAVPAYAGTDPHAVNPVLLQLIRNLIPGQAPLLRIGGDSTDWTWWPIPGMRQPAGVTYILRPAWMASARALAQATGAHLILGINLEADSTRIASAEARALLAGVGRQNVAALEIGNEPDLYGVFAWTHTKSGRPVIGRPPGYDFQDFSDEFSNFARTLPQFPLAGPATGDVSWLDNLKPFQATEPRLREVTFHRYGLNKCVTTPDMPTYPTVAHLLDLSTSADFPLAAEPSVATAHRLGLPFRVDEMNAVTCGGKWGVSNTFASALWALDALFSAAQAGVDGVNIQTSPFPGTPNQLFTFRHASGAWLGTVRPEYYGLMMFAQAAPPGARLLNVAGGSGQIGAWATLAPDGRTRVVLINDSLTQRQSVLVQPPRSGGTAVLERLQAPSAYATGAVTLGGQRIAATSASGTLTGASTGTLVAPAGGRYSLTLPAASAAMLTIPASPAAAGQ